MTYLCNDQLTRVRNPKVGLNWPVPKVYRVGDKGDKNGAPYVVRGFGVSGKPTDRDAWVWVVVKFRKVRGWQPLLIGSASGFAEKLVRGRHKNEVFNK